MIRNALRDKDRERTDTSAADEHHSQLIEHLNEDLAGELQAIGMYIQYSALLRGAHRKELRDLFQGEIPDEQRHAQLLADKIAVLGGIPTTNPRPVPDASNPLQMLNNIFKAESRAVVDYTARASEAEAEGEIGLKVELENVIVDETKHKEEVKRFFPAGMSRTLRFASEGAPERVGRCPLQPVETVRRYWRTMCKRRYKQLRFPSRRPVSNCWPKRVGFDSMCPGSSKRTATRFCIV